MRMTLRLCFMGVIGLAVLTASGCGPTAFIDGAYRSATYDDIVYVKKNKTLYKRRNRDGLFMHPALARQQAGHVWPSNKNIHIYTNYMVAYEDLTSRGVAFKVDPESRPDVAYRTHPRSVGPYGAADESQPINLNIPIADRGERNHEARIAFEKLKASAGQAKSADDTPKKSVVAPAKETTKPAEKTYLKTEDTPAVKENKPNTNAEEQPAVPLEKPKLDIQKPEAKKAPASKSVTVTTITNTGNGVVVETKVVTKKGEAAAAVKKAETK